MRQSMGKQNGFALSTVPFHSSTVCSLSSSCLSVINGGGCNRNRTEHTVSGVTRWLMTFSSLGWVTFKYVQGATALLPNLHVSRPISFSSRFEELVNDWGECNVSFFTHTLHVSRGGDFETEGKQADTSKCNLCDDNLPVNGSQIQSTCFQRRPDKQSETFIIWCGLSLWQAGKLTGLSWSLLLWTTTKCIF